MQLTTLQMLDDETVLLRLSHLYAVDEDAEMSEVVSVDVANALPMLNIDSMVELTLSANQVNEETVDIFLQQLAFTIQGFSPLAFAIFALSQCICCTGLVQEKATATKLKWKTQSVDSTEERPTQVSREVPLGIRRRHEDMTVNISPMEIRTFKLKLAPTTVASTSATASARRLK